MICFVEITLKESGDKVLVPAPLIKAVYVDDDNVVCLETHYNADGSADGYRLRESYDEIKSKLDKVAVVV